MSGIRKPRSSNHLAIALKGKADRHLHIGKSLALLWRYPAGAQCTKHRAYRVEIVPLVRLIHAGHG